MADLATIRAAVAAETAHRRRYWPCGLPTAADLAALRKQVAGRLKVTPEAVAQAVGQNPAELEALIAVHDEVWRRRTPAERRAMLRAQEVDYAPVMIGRDMGVEP